ncbi:MAG: Crp/Fnr family transcriptional regulator [Ruminococcaceae bacterium]|nr:Crp/Fnr family transcriptional regulator [Oscillospiraceae bacterium]
MDKIPLFLLEGLSPEVAQQYWQQAVTAPRSYEKGEVIYDSRTAQPSLAVVLSGTVRVLHGRVVMNTLRSGDVFGAAALFGGDRTYESLVMAHTPCQVAFIPQETVCGWMAAEPCVAINYVRFLSDRIRFLNRRLATLTAGQTDGKLWHFLLAQQQDGVVHLSGGMVELAKRLDMGRSSLYRSLEALAESGRIRRQGKDIYILKEDE